jgi:hypothetical protein
MEPWRHAAVRRFQHVLFRATLIVHFGPAPVRTLVIALVLSVCVGANSTPVGAASKYLALEPGVSTKADAARVLGAPAFVMGDILLEYAPQNGTGPIFVELATSSEIVERIEVRLPSAVTRAALTTSIALPATPTTTRTDRTGALLEYYGGGAAIVVAYRGADQASGAVSVSYYSDAAFARQVGLAQANPSPSTTTTPKTNVPGTGTPLPPTAPGPGGFPGQSAPNTPPPAPLPPAPLVNATAPSVTRDPLACYPLFTWARTEEEDAKRAKQTERRLLAMDIRISSQAGDCEQAKRLSDKYNVLYPGRIIR